MAMNLADGIQFLVQLGLYDVVLPFLLVFTLVYGMLEQSKVLGVQNGKPRHQLNAMVGLVVGFFTIASLQTIDVLQTLTQVGAVGAVIMVIFIIVLSLLGAKQSSKLMLTAALAIFTVGTLIVLNKLGVLPHSWSDMGEAGIGAPIMLIIFIALIWSLYAIYHKKEEPPKKAAKSHKTVETSAAKEKEEVPEPIDEERLSDKELEKPGTIWGHGH